LRTRALGAAVVAVCVALALPAQARGPQITDPKGDAAPGPAGADILSVTFTSTFKTVGDTRRPTGFTVRLVLAGAPSTQTWYRVHVTRPGCPDYFFNYSNGVAGTGTNDSGCTATTGLSTTDAGVKAATVSGSSVLWRVPISSFHAGTKLTNLSSDSQAFVGDPAGVATVELVGWDTATAHPGTSFTVGK